MRDESPEEGGEDEDKESESSVSSYVKKWIEELDSPETRVL